MTSAGLLAPISAPIAPKISLVLEAVEVVLGDDVAARSQAPLSSSRPPSTLCSASMDCGGTRSSRDVVVAGGWAVDSKGGSLNTIVP